MHSFSFGLFEESFGPVRWLDVFSGSGSVGLESLSRSDMACGGGYSAFVDYSPGCCQTVRDNLQALGVPDRGTAVQSDATAALLDPRAAGIEDGKFNVVSITPPYEEVVYAQLMDAVCKSPAVGEDTIVIVEVRVHESRSDELRKCSFRPDK